MTAPRQAHSGTQSPALTGISFDGWVLRTSPRELLRDGQRARLQDLPLQILEELVAHPGQLVTREQLIARLWPKGVVDFDGSLNAAMRKLRAALGDDADSPKYIETIPRQGYRFLGRIDVAPQAPSPPTSSGLVSPRLKRTVVLALVVLGVLGATAMIGGIMKARNNHSAAASVATTKVRIAVLPFENLSPDPADAFFADGLHEEVLSTLAGAGTHMDVISRTTMMVYRGTPKPVSAIARELGITHVLEGTVRREGDDVRLTLKLIDARSDTHVWSGRYDRKLTSAMTLQSQVATEIARQLAVNLSPAAESMRASTIPEAYDLYLKARLAAQMFRGRVALDSLLEVERWLDRAISLDPSFAAAYLQRSRIYLRKFDSSYDVNERLLGALRADLQQVRELAGATPLVLATESYYAQIVDGDLPRALRLMESPQVVASKDVTVLMARAALLATASRLDEAVSLYQEAARLDPGNEGLVTSWHALLWNARRPAEALSVVRALTPTAPAHVAFEFSFTGNTRQLDERINPVSDAIDPGARLMARVNRLRLRNQLADAVALLEGSELKTMRQDSFSPLTIPAIGRKPVAEMHGWAMLLRGDGAAAARDGREILAFVAREPVTKWNEWFLQVLAAEAALFSGQRDEAIAKARAALAMAPHRLNTAIDRYAPAITAMIFAWAGAQDEAVGLLETLSAGFPTLGPAEITREPLYSTPLAHNARYERLAQRLEAEIAANQRIFAAVEQ